MLTFPAIQQPSYPLSNKLEDPSLTSKTENGMVVSRPKFTRVRETFVLKWQALPAADYYKLRDFWKTTLGPSLEFEWTYPVIAGDPYSGKKFTMRFAGGDMNFSMDLPGYYSGELTVQEV